MTKIVPSSFSPFVSFVILINLFSSFSNSQILLPLSNKNDFSATIAADAAQSGRSVEGSKPFYPPPFALDKRVFVGPPPDLQHEKHFRDAAIPQPSVIIVARNGTASSSSAARESNDIKTLSNGSRAKDLHQKLIYTRNAAHVHMRRQPTLSRHQRRHRLPHQNFNSFHYQNRDPNNNSNFIPQISPNDFLPSSLLVPPFTENFQQPSDRRPGQPIKPLDANEPFMTSPQVQAEGEQPDEILDAPQQRRRQPPPTLPLASRLNLPQAPAPLGGEGPYGFPPMMPFGGGMPFGGLDLPPQPRAESQNLDGRVGFRPRQQQQQEPPQNANIFSSLSNTVDFRREGIGIGNGPTSPMGALEIADSFEPGAILGNNNQPGLDSIMPGGGNNNNGMDFFMNRAMNEMDSANNAVDTVIGANRMPTLNSNQPVNSSRSVTNVDPAHSLVSSSTVYRDPNSGGMGYFSEFKLLPNGQLSGAGGNDMPLTNVLKDNLNSNKGENALDRRSGIMQDELPIRYPNDNQQPMWFAPPPFLFNGGGGGGRASSPSKSLEELADKVLQAKQIRPIAALKGRKRVNRRKLAAVALDYTRH